MNFDPRLWRGGPNIEDLGQLSVPSGRVQICDPGTLFDPVAVEVPAGQHLARVLKSRDGDNVAAALVVRKGEPVSWEEVGNYGVDAGMSGFFDGALFDQVDAHDFDVSIYDDLISRHLEPAEREGHAGTLIPFDGATFSACRSGWGDGIYPVHVGRGVDGGVEVIVTTFLDDDEDDEDSVEDEPTERA